MGVTVTLLALSLFNGGMHAAAVVRGSQVRAFELSGTTTYWIQALGGKPLSAYAVTYGFVKKGGKKEFAFCVLQYQTMPKPLRYAVSVSNPYDFTLGRDVTQATLRLPSGRLVELPWYWPLIEIRNGKLRVATKRFQPAELLAYVQNGTKPPTIDGFYNWLKRHRKVGEKREKKRKKGSGVFPRRDATGPRRQ